MPRTTPPVFKTETGDRRTYNVQPLLHEIRHAVTRLLDSGESTIIDLRSIPLAPGEEAELISALGKGEVHANMSALGPSEVYETGFPGVWLVTHYNSEQEIIGRFIEIIDMPWILKSQHDDIRDGLERLEQRLD